MFYEIMHRESCVAQLSTTGECRVCLEDFMPYDLVLVESDDFDERINNVTNFYYWCASRMLTLDRTYAKEILNSIGASQSVTDRERAQIALSYHCLSLLDVFWVKEKNEMVRFEEINLYTHSLSNALVDIALRGHQMTVTNAHLLANDLSTGGLYPKAWVRKEDGFYLYKVRWGEDSIFNAAAGISGKPRLACGIKGIYCFHQPDSADGNKILLIARQGVVFFYDVRHQPQIVADQLFPRSGIPCTQGAEGGGFLPGCEWTRKAAAFQMERQKQKFCGEKLQQGQQHTISLPVHSC